MNNFFCCLLVNQLEVFEVKKQQLLQTLFVFLIIYTCIYKCILLNKSIRQMKDPDIRSKVPRLEPANLHCGHKYLQIYVVTFFMDQVIKIDLWKVSLKEGVCCLLGNLFNCLSCFYTAILRLKRKCRTIDPQDKYFRGLQNTCRH